VTIKDALSFTADSAVAAEARKVAHAHRWLSLEGNGKVLWGEFKTRRGSIRSEVDLRHDKPGFKCSCRSRKSPCKHSFGLLMLLVKNSDAFRVVEEPPEETTQWLKRRDSHIAPPERTPEEEAKLAAQRQKNREKRFSQMAKGIDELEVWLLDVLREGLAALHGQPPEYWEERAARLVDAKMKAVANRVKNLAFVMQAADWHEQTLQTFGELFLLIKAFRQRAYLPQPLQQELLNTAGVNFKKDDLLAEKGVQDDWVVLGREEGEEENLYFQRIWLLGVKTNRYGLRLEFNYGSPVAGGDWPIGTFLKAEVVFYPSSFPQRVLFKKYELTKPQTTLSYFQHFAAFAKAYAEAVAANPWLVSFPGLIQKVIPVSKDEQYFLTDTNQQAIVIPDDEDQFWTLFALSGGHPIAVFGNWNGSIFRPLSAEVQGRWVGL